MTAVVANRPEDYRRLGLDRDTVEPWEDGLRTGGVDGTFEWWYLDCHLEDGSTLTVELHTKPPYLSPSSPLTPFVWVTLDSPDGTQLQRTSTFAADAFAASAEGCDVVIGPNTFRVSGEQCHVHVEVDEVVADVRLTAEVPPWRPGTGQVLFGDDEGDYIAWLPSMSRASAEVTLTVTGIEEQLRGAGYHDHNWGNIAPRKVLDHWYWGRARLGEFTIVTLLFVCDEAHDKQPIPVVMLAKDGSILVNALGPHEVSFEEREHRENGVTGVPVARTLVYEVEAGGVTYVITFDHQRDGFMLDFGPKGAYHRLLGDATLQCRSGGQVEEVTGKTMWELLYFGALPENARPSEQSKAPVLIPHQA